MLTLDDDWTSGLRRMPAMSCRHGGTDVRRRTSLADWRTKKRSASEPLSRQQDNGQSTCEGGSNEAWLVHQLYRWLTVG